MPDNAALLGHLQAVCVDALYAEIDRSREVALAAPVCLEHTGTAAVGDTVRANGLVIGIRRPFGEVPG